MCGRAATIVMAMGLGGCGVAVSTSTQQPALPATGPTMGELLEASSASDWRALEPENTLYLELTRGRVILELAPTFAPNHVTNIKLLTRERYFDGLSILRSQDNYVVQWGDPDDQRPLGSAKASVPAEFTRSRQGLPFVSLTDLDVYAPEAGFVEGFPAGGDPASGRAWLVHCYGMVGVARDEGADSGSGAGLYVVIGHAPRHLDQNITVVGRVVRGMELLSTLPRGTGEMGFYEDPEEYVALRSVRVEADVPVSERTEVELLRTDSPTFAALIGSRKMRSESWFKAPAHHVELCNVPLPSRPRGTAAPVVVEPAKE